MAYLYTILVYLRHLQDSMSEKLTNSFQEHALNMYIESFLNHSDRSTHTYCVWNEALVILKARPKNKM